MSEYRTYTTDRGLKIEIVKMDDETCAPTNPSSFIADIIFTTGGTLLAVLFVLFFV